MTAVPFTYSEVTVTIMAFLEALLWNSHVRKLLPHDSGTWWTSYRKPAFRRYIIMGCRTRVEAINGHITQGHIMQVMKEILGVLLPLPTCAACYHVKVHVSLQMLEFWVSEARGGFCLGSSRPAKHIFLGNTEEQAIPLTAPSTCDCCHVTMCQTHSCRGQLCGFTFKFNVPSHIFLLDFHFATADNFYCRDSEIEIHWLTVIPGCIQSISELSWYNWWCQHHYFLLVVTYIWWAF